VTKSISLDDLIGLNDEIAGLVRSGVPLPLGLASWSQDLDGRLARAVAGLEQALASGQSLPQALETLPDDVPPLYRAVVAAGLRSGRLSAALESLSMTARHAQQTRGALALALLYPLVLVLVAYFLFMVLVGMVLPAQLSLYESSPPPFFAKVASGFARFLETSIPIPGTDRALSIVLLPPLALVAIFAIWWWRTRNASMFDVGSAARWLGWGPVAGRTVRRAETATLAEILGLLVEHDVPIGEAVVLTAQCTSDRALVTSAQAFAASMAQGCAPEDGRETLSGFPPLLVWLISSAAPQHTFVRMARHIAETNRRRAARDAQWLRDYLPMWLVLGIGGTVLLIYSLGLFLPYSQLLETLSHYVGRSLRIR